VRDGVRPSLTLRSPLPRNTAGAIRITKRSRNFERYAIRLEPSAAADAHSMLAEGSLTFNRS
jgi:hypothetical protein